MDRVRLGRPAGPSAVIGVGSTQGRWSTCTSRRGVTSAASRLLGSVTCDASRRAQERGPSRPSGETKRLDLQHCRLGASSVQGLRLRQNRPSCLDAMGGAVRLCFTNSDDTEPQCLDRQVRTTSVRTLPRRPRRSGDGWYGRRSLAEVEPAEKCQAGLTTMGNAEMLQVAVGEHEELRDLLVPEERSGWRTLHERRDSFSQTERFPERPSVWSAWINSCSGGEIASRLARTAGGRAVVQREPGVPRRYELPGRSSSVSGAPAEASQVIAASGPVVRRALTPARRTCRHSFGSTSLPPWQGEFPAVGGLALPWPSGSHPG
jgi:hypothetical protein